MNVKEYLTQAYRIDQRINSKLEQIAALRGLTRRLRIFLSKDESKCDRKRV